MKFAIFLSAILFGYIFPAGAGEVEVPGKTSPVDLDQQAIAFTEKHPGQYVMRDCPIVGNRETGLYHRPGQPNYRQMLIINKGVRRGQLRDNRECFDSTDEAEATDVPCVVRGEYAPCPEASRKYRPAMN